MRFWAHVSHFTTTNRLRIDCLKSQYSAHWQPVDAIEWCLESICELFRCAARKRVHIVLYADTDEINAFFHHLPWRTHKSLPRCFFFLFCFLEEEKITVCAYSLGKWHTILHIYINSNYAYEYGILSAEKWLKWWMRQANKHSRDDGSAG